MKMSMQKRLDVSLFDLNLVLVCLYSLLDYKCILRISAGTILSFMI
jgi:hypothetical protein